MNEGLQKPNERELRMLVERLLEEGRVEGDPRWLLVSRGKEGATHFDIVPAPSREVAEKRGRKKRGQKSACVALGEGEMVEILVAMVAKDTRAIGERWLRED